MNNPSQALAALAPEVRLRVDQWLNGSFDSKTKDKIRELLRDNPQEIVDAFYTNLSFGTGGLRGVMGVGTNRMNKYTVQFATQGLANYMKQQPAPAQGHAVFIGYDCRHDSDRFAIEAARVLAGNGIRVFITEALRPTPLVSFGCRYKGCTAAIMITASHNPPAYNGYKVYWNDGGQVLPPHDQGIINEVRKINEPSQVQLADPDTKLIQRVGRDVDSAYLDAISTLQHYPEVNRAEGGTLKVVFTNLHGTAATLVPGALKRWGFTQRIDIEEQLSPSGDFPTVESANPEDPKALALGIKKLCEVNGDILLGTDPDADRVGAVVLHNGEPVILTGNQVACLCLAHVCEALHSQHRLPANAAFVKTVVTSELFKTIAEHYNRLCLDVLPGFKYIAECIRNWELQGDIHRFLFGGEESYGYLLGTNTRDKDAVIICALLCEVALHAKRSGKTLVDRLNALYRQHGIHREKLLSLNFPETQAGREQMNAAMRSLRASPPRAFGGSPIKCVEDYQTSIRTFTDTGKAETITLAKSNMLIFWLADETKVVIRPSGTEPKVKCYCGVVYHGYSDIERGIVVADSRANEVLEEIRRTLIQ